MLNIFINIHLKPFKEASDNKIMKKWVASAATAATSLLLTFSCTHPNSSGANALSLESRHKFFSQLASGAIKGATTAVVPQIAPGLTQLPTAAPPTAAAANQAERPAIPAVDVGILLI